MASTASMASPVGALPNEILHNIFRAWNLYVSSTAALFKDNYNFNLDSRPDEAAATLRDDLKDFVQVRTLMCGYKSIEEKTLQVELVSSLAAKLLRTADPGSYSRNIAKLHFWIVQPKLDDMNAPEWECNREAFLNQSVTYIRASTSTTSTPRPSLSARRASAKLHVLYGLPILHPDHEKFNGPYPYAVSMIYDLRNYTEANQWGPFLSDGQSTVDWEKIEAIMIVLGYNLQWFEQQRRDLVRSRQHSFIDSRPYTYRPLSPLSDIVGIKLKPDFFDPYNITGTYKRIVCFLDYHDLFRYNFTDDRPGGVPRPPLDEEEALRFINMRLRAVRIEKPGPKDGQDYPIVHFEGDSRALHGSALDARSALKGTVRQTKEGEIRWASVSIYGDEERWGSEGIQVGGIQSKRGVLGVWFDRHHRETGPVGPTAFWKLSDSQYTRKEDVELDLDLNADGDTDDSEESMEA